jgi:hypothetical protein
MILYELHGYRTDHYDRGSERRIRLKDCGFKAGRVEAWIAAFLAEFPDGKVVVSVVDNPQHHTERVRKIDTRTGA